MPGLASIPSTRVWRLIVGVGVAVLALVLPILVLPTRLESGLGVLAAGLLLGIGRQGWDVLGLRLLTTSLIAIGTPLALVPTRPVGETGTTAARGAPEGLQLFAVVVLVGSLFLTMVFAVIAVPTTVIWNRGIASLRPELPWHRIPRPRVWWQWALAGLGAYALLLCLQLLLGIPSP